MASLSVEYRQLINVLGWKGLHDWTIMRKKENRILNDLFRKAEKTILTGRISGFFR